MSLTNEIRIDDNFFHLLDTFSQAAEQENVQWLMVGATARVLLLEKLYGWEPGVRTEDIDFAVQVADWKQYEALCNRLASSGSFRPMQKPAKRFATDKKLVFDLIPYGGVEEGIKQVYWPPHKNELMTVRGFHSAHEDAVKIMVNSKIEVPVISPRALCALKLFAWEERHQQEPGRDAKDLAYVLKNCHQLYPAAMLHAEHEEALERNDYDPNLAAISVLGEAVKDLLEQDDYEFLKNVVSEELSQEDVSGLARDLNKYLNHPDMNNVIKMLESFQQTYK
ncbi:MAG: nucleotidyl transferase AbiEii/AbiGii toxin family protein [Arenicellales bacterium]